MHRASESIRVRRTPASGCCGRSVFMPKWWEGPKIQEEWAVPSACAAGQSPTRRGPEVQTAPPHSL